MLYLPFWFSVDPNDQKKTACYDIDVEVDDPLKAQMSNFLQSTTNQQEIANLDVKVRFTYTLLILLKDTFTFENMFHVTPVFKVEYVTYSRSCSRSLIPIPM